MRLKLEEKESKDKLNVAVTGEATIGNLNNNCMLMQDLWYSSMGHVVGEKITAIKEKSHTGENSYQIYSCSGDCLRMQGGGWFHWCRWPNFQRLSIMSRSAFYISFLTDHNGRVRDYLVCNNWRYNPLAGLQAYRFLQDIEVIAQTIGTKLPRVQSAEFYLNTAHRCYRGKRGRPKVSLRSLLTCGFKKVKKDGRGWATIQRNDWPQWPKVKQPKAHGDQCSAFKKRADRDLLQGLYW